MLGLSTGVQIAQWLAQCSDGTLYRSVLRVINAIEDLCFGNRNVVSIRFYPAPVKCHLEALKNWALECAKEDGLSQEANKRALYHRTI